MKSQARWLDLVTASLLLAVAVPIAYLPSWIAYPIGEALGRLAYLADRRHRRVAAENLRLAFGSACGPNEIHTMARAHFRCLGQTFVETCRLIRLSPQHLMGAVAVDGTDGLHAVKATGRGVLYVSAHFGPWEYLPAVWTHWFNEPLTVVARPFDNPYLDRWVNALRRRWGTRVVEKRDAMKELMDVLRRGGKVGVLIDQHVSRREGVVVSFFGHPASTTHAPALLALRSGAAVIPVVVLREGRGRFRILLGKEVSPPRTGETKADVVAMTAAMTAALEELIRRCPEQWLWVHRRWKYLTEEKGEGIKGLRAEGSKGSKGHKN
ncbi:MAG: lysophospholipid acyltransferase family protein [Candidatus Methylomirabilis sp.]